MRCLLILLLACCGLVHGETFGAKFARCFVQEENKPGFQEDAAWARCEKTAQAQRDAEFAADRTAEIPPEARRATAAAGTISMQTLAETYPETAALIRGIEAQAFETPSIWDRYVGKALAAFFSSIALVFIFAVVRFKPWNWRPRPLATDARIAVAMSAVWVLALQLWGFIWGWGHYFSGDEYAVLHIAVPLLGLAGSLGYRWARRG